MKKFKILLVAFIICSICSAQTDWTDYKGFMCASGLDARVKKLSNSESGNSWVIEFRNRYEKWINLSYGALPTNKAFTNNKITEDRITIKPFQTETITIKISDVDNKIHVHVKKVSFGQDDSIEYNCMNSGNQASFIAPRVTKPSFGSIGIIPKSIMKEANLKLKSNLEKSYGDYKDDKLLYGYTPNSSLNTDNISSNSFVVSNDINFGGRYYWGNKTRSWEHFIEINADGTAIINYKNKNNTWKKYEYKWGFFTIDGNPFTQMKVETRTSKYDIYPILFYSDKVYTDSIGKLDNENENEGAWSIVHFYSKNSGSKYPDYIDFNYNALFYKKL